MADQEPALLLGSLDRNGNGSGVDYGLRTFLAMPLPSPGVAREADKPKPFRVRLNMRFQDLTLCARIGATLTGPVGEHAAVPLQRQGQRPPPWSWPYPTVSLAEARRLREQQRRLRKEQRLDPIQERRKQDNERELAEQRAAQAAAVAKARSVSFSQAADEYITAHKPEWGVKYAAQWQALIDTYATRLRTKAF